MASQLTINGVTINNAECVNKSYPNFWQFVKKNVI
jgi:5-enolpyruvylshikimate-3-phosphate synthase